ncbi:hypothetical protein TpMuguga_01g00902 [Theileria parva strain Muguga]|uniref:uncharacterized protein n=1 Tax=Theileria parva strain Muguga TaxID=333668 RepID=UPI001C61A0D5|nr:uncharacterized protein TpMuguga_01g00902 [Theileria parva strain Muguga]EAN34140.2 hypothetical protein TpMuguga_01g00902 [Theileria parva strain Muguga]
MYNNCSSGHVCDRLSHLIYRLHPSLDYKHKFILSTKLFNFKGKIESEEVCKQIITALDPEFIYLLLRSSTIFKIIGLELSNMLLCTRDSAKHMRNIVAYISNILGENLCRKEFKFDSSTKAISDKIGESETVWIRLIYESLSCLLKLSEHLNSEFVFEYSDTVDVNEMEESLEYLINDMFDISLTNTDDKKEYSVQMKEGSQELDCVLCDLLSKKEFKEEHSLLMELYKDLNSLAEAHLQELDFQDSETPIEKSIDLTKTKLFKVLYSLLDSLLEDLREKSEGVLMSLSCIQLLVRLVPHNGKILLVEKCIKSNNFDLLKLLIHYLNELNCKSDVGGGSQNRFEINLMVSKRCLDILDTRITRDNMAYLLNFLTTSIQNRVISLSNETCVGFLKLAKRCEVEIHLTLDEVLRIESSLVNSSPFEALEGVMTSISEFIEPFEKMEEFFSLFHRTIQLLFDFFDQIESCKFPNSSSISRCKHYSVRLLGCWMTLEPMHFKHQYLSKLSKIIECISEFDFIWLLPSFNYIDASDIYTVDGLANVLIKLFFGVVNFDEKSGTCRNAIKMLCEVVTRIHLDPLVDYELFLKKINHNLLSEYDGQMCKVAPEIQIPDYVLEGGKFCPSNPVEFLPPISVNLDKSDSYKLLSESLLNLLCNLCQKSEEPFIKGIFQENHDINMFINTLVDKHVISDDEFDLLCVATLACGSCLVRVTERTAVNHLGTSPVILVMELVILFFVQTSPRAPEDYLDDQERISKYISLCKVSLMLMNNYSNFSSLFQYTVKKIRLRIPRPEEEEFEKLIEEGFMYEEDLSICELFSSYVSNILS